MPDAGSSSSSIDGFRASMQPARAAAACRRTAPTRTSRRSACMPNSSSSDSASPSTRALLVARRRQPEGVRQRAAAVVAVRARPEVVDDRQVREQPHVLQRPPDAEARRGPRASGPAGRRRGSVIAPVVHGAEAGDAVHERRLAGAVRADEADDLALADLEVDVVDGAQAAELHGDARVARRGRPAVASERAVPSSATWRPSEPTKPSVSWR